MSSIATSSDTGKPKPKYPGYGMNLRWMLQSESVSARRNLGMIAYPMGIHGECYGNNSMIITVREVAMMLVMDRLTDKPDWHIKVFNDEIAEKWRQEAMAWPEDDLWNRIQHFEIDEGRQNLHPDWYPERPKNLLDRACVDYCIQELRHKAEHFERTGIIPTLDATFSIAKSDTIVPESLHQSLREAFARLQADQVSNPDWHPNTNETVQDLVHPSMYPLIYGRSLFLENEEVGVEDAVDKWAGKGKVIPRHGEKDSSTREAPPRRQYRYDRVGSGKVPLDFWSNTYQWLPANLKFTDDGGVKFASYINNLHPTKYRDIYSTIEKLVEKSLPLWDLCLSRYGDYKNVGAGRREPRIMPDEPDDENPENWKPREGTSGKKKSRSQDEEAEEEDEDEDYDEDEDRGEPVHPDPPSFESSKVDYTVDPTKTLREMFKDTGLQIIVKMATIQLTPEKPEFSPGGWHVEGMMNEHIAGTALYYLDSENITESHLEFRSNTTHYFEDEDDRFRVSQNGYHWMESVYGATFGSGNGSPCLQNYGSVLTPQGRLLAFPNVFQHRVSGFKLADPTKPGHRRFIALWLVDPTLRIINTGNVPPQQAEWWAEAAFSKKSTNMPPEVAQLLVEKGLVEEKQLDLASSKTGGKLPAELLEMVREELKGAGLPMTREEAEEHRLKLMKERSVFGQDAQHQWDHRASYSFCEH
ncbi:hypothetical protein QBC35DRAFT_473900 [Podospora australis]|uniref:Uncharacterized protein n=1 Tax=Podospora australis TaxID=1536484 RepID=A0AAN6WTZ8_9PEZI|nr:hypothetical protein QBC35DRAFT_473900 [Podospora australis]